MCSRRIAFIYTAEIAFPLRFQPSQHIGVYVHRDRPLDWAIKFANLRVCPPLGWEGRRIGIVRVDFLFIAFPLSG
jgi:hypothetical protein